MEQLEALVALQRARITFRAWAVARPFYWKPLMLLGARACSAVINASERERNGFGGSNG